MTDQEIINRLFAGWIIYKIQQPGKLERTILQSPCEAKEFELPPTAIGWLYGAVPMREFRHCGLRAWGVAA